MSTFIAIESGATQSVAGLYDNEQPPNLLSETTGKPANPVEHGVVHAIHVLTELVSELRRHDTVAVFAGVAGAGKGSLAHELATALSQATGIESITVTNDIAPIFHANFPVGPGILVIAGTGSSVMARDEQEAIALTGGHGALLGDRGSAYRIGVAALEACAAMLDGTGEDTALLDTLLNQTNTSNIDELVLWSSSASKSELAALAPSVIECAGNQDDVAASLVADQAAFLADQTSMAKHINHLESDTPVMLYGGLITNSEIFRTVYLEALRNLWPEVTPQHTPITGHAAVAKIVNQSIPGIATVTHSATPSLPPTEQTGIAPKPMDTMTALEITDWMTDSGEAVHRALQNARQPIATAIDRAAQAYQQGGRVIYVGAGTSGRMGVIDASECPPTFGVQPERFIGLIAGGDQALRNSVEGAEDDRDQAVVDLKSLSPFPSTSDFVVGITASGTTPYVLSALDYARSLGTSTALVTCNPVFHESADIHIIIETGPEVLPGSTRLKAGTATKLALNQITTGAMARCGHIYEGRMVGVRGVNDKLRHRTVRVTADLLDTTEGDALDALNDANGDIKVAILMRKKQMSQQDAAAQLAVSGGHLRDALDT